MYLIKCKQCMFLKRFRDSGELLRKEFEMQFGELWSLAADYECEKFKGRLSHLYFSKIECNVSQTTSFGCPLMLSANPNDLRVQCPREDRAECWKSRSVWLKAERIEIVKARMKACETCNKRKQETSPAINAVTSKKKEISGKKSLEIEERYNDINRNIKLVSPEDAEKMIQNLTICIACDNATFSKEVPQDVPDLRGPISLHTAYGRACYKLGVSKLFCIKICTDCASKLASIAASTGCPAGKF